MNTRDLAGVISHDEGDVVWVPAANYLEPEHFFGPEGFDVWGYDRGGHYERVWDRRPLAGSPYIERRQREVLT